MNLILDTMKLASNKTGGQNVTSIILLTHALVYQSITCQNIQMTRAKLNRTKKITIAAIAAALIILAVALPLSLNKKEKVCLRPL